MGDGRLSVIFVEVTSERGERHPPFRWQVRLLRRMLDADLPRVVDTRVPSRSPNIVRWKSSWGAAPEVGPPEHSFPFPDLNSPATLSVVLRDDDGNAISLDCWGDAMRRDNVKFWAGAAGYPGAAIVRDALGIARGKTRQHAADPFALSNPQSSSFRFDWRRDYINEVSLPRRSPRLHPCSPGCGMRRRGACRKQFPKAPHRSRS